MSSRDLPTASNTAMLDSVQSNLRFVFFAHGLAPLFASSHWIIARRNVMIRDLMPVWDFPEQGHGTGHIFIMIELARIDVHMSLQTGSGCLDLNSKLFWPFKTNETASDVFPVKENVRDSQLFRLRPSVLFSFVLGEYRKCVKLFELLPINCFKACTLHANVLHS